MSRQPYLSVDEYVEIEGTKVIRNAAYIQDAKGKPAIPQTIDKPRLNYLLVEISNIIDEYGGRSHAVPFTLPAPSIIKQLARAMMNKDATLNKLDLSYLMNPDDPITIMLEKLKAGTLLDGILPLNEAGAEVVSYDFSKACCCSNVNYGR